MPSSDYIYSSDYQIFLKWLRRENANIFDVFFHDKELVEEEYIKDEVLFLSEFFELNEPDIEFESGSPLEVRLDDIQGEVGACISCNIKKLEECGFNNKDAVVASLCHEFSHIYSHGHCYGYCDNEYWEAELYADFMASAVMTALNVAGGKYRYIIGEGKATLTHPYGEYRLRCAKAAREYVLSLPLTKKIALDDVESQFLLFLLTSVKEINGYLYEHEEEIEHALEPKNEVKIDYMQYSDSNLIKQYILQHQQNND